MRRENPGGIGAPVISVVVTASIALPIALSVTSGWLLLLFIGFSYPAVGLLQELLWLLWRGARWVVRLCGWVCILAGITLPVTIAFALPQGSPWLWPTALGGSVLHGLIMYWAVLEESRSAWMEEHLPDLGRIMAELESAAQHRDGPFRLRYVASARGRQLFGLSPPPFGLSHVLFTELGNFELRVAQHLWDEGAVEESLEHLAEASALQQIASRGYLGAIQRRHLLKALAVQATYLSVAGQTAHAIVVGDQEICVGRELVARIARKQPEHRAIGDQALGLALLRQADRLETVGRRPDADRHRAEAHTLGVDPPPPS